MIAILAFRHLLVRRLRSLFLLLGFSLGVGVMIVLLSVGQAMLDQSRDVSLVGGGELTVLPQGIDIEAMRTGGVSGMFFGIDRARFLTRQLFGGARHESHGAHRVSGNRGKAALPPPWWPNRGAEGRRRDSQPRSARSGRVYLFCRVAGQTRGPTRRM